jgi:DNA-directed RNA polymerase subunit RPC12/RpoP
MSVVIRYVCHHCGAAREGGGGAGWVRCAHCGVLIAFDWQAWLGSAEYAAYLRVATKPEALAGWQRYQALTAEVDQALAAKDEPRARDLMRQAVEQMVAQLPAVYPPELSTDAAYRERYFRWLTWTMFIQKADPQLAALASSLQACLRRFDHRDPMPVLDEAAQLLTKQADRTAALGPPDDPDGMPPPARLRASLSQFLGGYVQSLSPDQVRALLERIHGRGNVHEAGEGVETLGLFRDWRCPACGAVSLQANSVHEHTCPGCAFRLPKSVSPLPRFELQCGRCGAAVVLEEGERERCCAFCDTWVRRVDRTGDIEREYTREVMASYAQQFNLAMAPLPAEGQPGVPVTTANRRELQVIGLARSVAMYGALVPPSRVLALVTATFPAVKGPALRALLEEIAAAARTERQPGAAKVLDEVRALLA